MLRLKLSYAINRASKKGKVGGLPFALSIEPTTACNLGCPECPSGLKQFTRPTGKMDLGFHSELLQQVSKHVFYINYYFQGEPFLHPQFLDLIREAKTKKIYTSTSTNAHFIDGEMAKNIIDSGLDKLIISIDGLTQETYENYRVGGNLDKVLEATRLLVNEKSAAKSSTPHLIFQFLAVRQNEHEIERVHELAKDLGVDEVRIKTAQLYDYENGNPLMPTDEKYSRYKRLPNGKYKVKHVLGNHCWRMWSSSVVTWDGGVVPCCFDKDARYRLGLLSNQQFEKIWSSKDYVAFRKNVLVNRNEIDICKNCSEGTSVWK